MPTDRVGGPGDAARAPRSMWGPAVRCGRFFLAMPRVFVDARWKPPYPGGFVHPRGGIEMRVRACCDHVV